MKKKFILLVILLFSIGMSVMGANKYKGGELYSNDAVLFGKFEIRMKMVSESGVVSSFFLYDNKSWQGLPFKWREIDIESIGIKKGAFQTNIITGHSADKVMSEEVADIPDLSTEYHTFAIEWTPDYVAWLIDGKVIRKITAEESQQIIDLRDTPQTYRANLWIAVWEEWVGKFKPVSLPLYQYINWIKYYKYTPGKGENGSDFKLDWTDDFNTFDKNRWGKGNWSFDGNLVDFAPENIVIKDGYLIICVTKGFKSGHKGAVPPDNK